jgi:hypothetical protein
MEPRAPFRILVAGNVTENVMSGFQLGSADDGVERIVRRGAKGQFIHEIAVIRSLAAGQRQQVTAGRSGEQNVVTLAAKRSDQAGVR